MNVTPPRAGQPHWLMRLPSTPWLVVLLLLFTAPLIALVQYIAWWRWDVVDDQMFAYFGWRIMNGARVYLDVWDNKPPGIYWINAIAMWLGGGSYAGVIAMCVLALLIAHLAYFAICLTVAFPGTAFLSTLIFSFYVTHIYYTGGTNRTETFLVACELTAVALYARGFTRNSLWNWLGAGLWCGAAFVFKQVGAAAFGAMGLHLLLLGATRRISLRAMLGRQILLLIGFVITVSAAVLYLYVTSGARGVYEAYFATFAFNVGYIEHGASQFPFNILNWIILRDHFLPIMLMPFLLMVVSVVHASAWAISPATRPAGLEAAMANSPRDLPLYLPLFLIWMGLAFYGALISPHAFRHYLVPTIPPLLLSGLHLLNYLHGEGTLFTAIQRSALVTVAFVALGYFCAEAAKRNFEEFSKVWVYRTIQGRLADWEQAGEVIRHITGPDDPIYCWGYFPGVYLDAKRVNSCRFTTTEKVGQLRSRASFVLEEVEQTLKEKPPVALVISSQDYAWMSGILPDFPAPKSNMAEWIDTNYTRVADLTLTTPVYVYKRNDRFRPTDFWNGYRPPGWESSHRPSTEPSASEPASSGAASSEPASSEADAGEPDAPVSAPAGANTPG